MEAVRNRTVETRPLQDRQRDWALFHLLATLADIAASVETQSGAASQPTLGSLICHNDKLDPDDAPHEYAARASTEGMRSNQVDCKDDSAWAERQ